MHQLKKRFEEFSHNRNFVKADLNHILDWNIGLDDDGNKALKMRGNFTPRLMKGTVSVGVKQFTKGEKKTIIFSLLNDEVCDQFYRFCEDMIEATQNVKSDDEGYNIITKCFICWKKMFLNSKGDLLNENEIMGLIGELLFLKQFMFSEYGQHKALRSWSGQELTHKDFSTDDIWYEVKSINKGKNTVQISSIEQLEGKNPGELVIYMLEKMSPQYKGIGLNELVDEIYKSIQMIDDRTDFMGKVSMQGFAYNEYYDEFIYEADKCIRYWVINDFPRLKHSDLGKAIVKARYDIDLTEIDTYKIEG